MTTSRSPENRIACPVSLAISIDAKGWPRKADLARLSRRAVGAAAAEAGFISARGHKPELSISFTDDSAMRVLNAHWRGKDKPTNVLSFPAVSWNGMGEAPPLLGDIALARETVEREAAEQGKLFGDHLAHLLVHGFLHLVGHDHENEDEADAMETLERRALARLAIPDPYAVSDTDG